MVVVICDDAAAAVVIRHAVDDSMFEHWIQSLSACNTGARTANV